MHRLWQEQALRPHQHKTFKLSRDPKFLEKLTDVVGVYLTPPPNAVVLCVDEKSQIQALDRTQPGLPLKKGRYGTLTHDYKRHGTTFGELTQKAVRRGVFRSVAELEAAIAQFMAVWNAQPKPFIWTASVAKILEKLARCRVRLEQIQPGCTQPKLKK